MVAAGVGVSEALSARTIMVRGRETHTVGEVPRVLKGEIGFISVLEYIFNGTARGWTRMFGIFLR